MITLVAKEKTMPRQLSPETEALVIQLYKEGKQRQEIAAACQIHKGSIGRILRDNGIERTRVKRVSPEDVTRIIQLYKDGVSSEIIADNLNIDGGTVRRKLRQNGIEIRPATENKRQYKINDTFFEKIDTESNAYFLGFLYADGGLTSRGNCIRLELQEQDINILKQLSMIIYGFIKIDDDPLKDKNGNVIRQYKMINIYSQKMHNDLIKLGCTPKKSFTITFPSTDIVPDHLMHHFIRGFMDGDGCICITNENRPRVDFTSTLQFLEGLAGYLKIKLGLDITRFSDRHPERENNTRSIQIQGFSNTRLLLDYLYTGATIFLTRKKDHYDEIKKQQQRKSTKSMIKSTDISLYGTTYIPEYNGNQLTQEYLKTLTINDKNHIADMLLKFYRENGFPYTKLSNDKIVKEFTALKNCDPTKIENGKVLQLSNQLGIPIFKHFSPHFYEVKPGENSRPSTLEVFNDDLLLKKVIENRINANYNMTGDMLKQGLRNSKIAFMASIFNPTIAKYIYSKYTNDGDIIYDYSAGFGQRLLAALSLPYNITYVGADPLDKSIASNQAIFDFLNTNIPMLNKTVDLTCIGSENFCNDKYIGKVKLAFSSPPYYNLEIYDQANNQAYSGGYVEFINKYWRKTVENIDKLLTDDGVFILNVNEIVNGFSVGEDMRNVIKEADFDLTETYYIQLTRNKKFGGEKEEHKLEPILVFKRK